MNGPSVLYCRIASKVLLKDLVNFIQAKQYSECVEEIAIAYICIHLCVYTYI